MPMPLISCKDFESSCCDSHSTTYVLLFMATCVLRALNTINYIWRDSWMKWWFTTSFTICKRDRWMKWWFTTSFTICNFHLPVQLSNGKWLSVQQETKALFMSVAFSIWLLGSEQPNEMKRGLDCFQELSNRSIPCWILCVKFTLLLPKFLQMKVTLKKSINSTYYPCLALLCWIFIYLF